MMFRRWLALLGLIVPGCGSSNPATPVQPTADPGHAVLAQGARVLDDAGLAALTSVSAEGTFVFQSASPALAQIAVGNVLIVGVGSLTPHGALIKIGRVTPQESGLVVATSPATLSEAFEELQLTVRTTLMSHDATLLSPMAHAQQNGLAFPFNLSGSDKYGSIGLDGSLSLASSTVYRAPSDSMYGSAYAVAVRPNGNTLIVGRRADTVSDLLTNEDILLIQGGAYGALGGAGNDAVYVGVNSGHSNAASAHAG